MEEEFEKDGKRFEVYRRLCRSCLTLYYTKQKHSKVCGECKLRTKHMRDLKLLKQKQRQEIEEYLKNQKLKLFKVILLI